ncbi:hypothetical protein FJY71_08110, partial [candidate division WOR-3 bacterium]|nr:hypothetical protein [candidate division WOR-3 bacterium]
MAVRVGAGLALLLAAAAAGPQGFSSLKIAPGVREAGMGGTGCASAIGPQAVAWNPAATADAGSFAAVAGYTKWLLDTRQQSLFLSRGLGGFALGAGVSSFAAGSFEYREEVPTGEPLGTFEPVELTVYLNASRPVGPAGRPVGSLGASVR